LEKKIKLLSVEQAQRIIFKNIKPLKFKEKINIENSYKRVLRSNINSKRNQPELDLSSMDGYAVRKKDLNKIPITLKLIGEIKAGDRVNRGIQKNQAFRIYTGAPIPKGADKIIIQENCIETEDEVSIKKENKDNFIRKKSNDISNKFVLKAPKLINTRDIALMGVMNQRKIEVFRKPKIGILATGDEITEVGEKTNKYNQPASSKPSIISLIKNWGGDPIDFGIAKDKYMELSKKIKKANKCDLFITIGGASVGKYDLIHSSLIKFGFKLDFWKIAMQPGKPMMFGSCKKTFVMGLPGNPVSALICSEIFLKKAIYALQGIKHEDFTINAILDNDIAPTRFRKQYLRGNLYFDKKTSEMRVKLLKNQDSASLYPYSKSNSLIMIDPHSKKQKKGSKVRVYVLNN